MIRTWGHGNRQRGYIGALVQAWEDGFRQQQPGITFQTTLWGDKSAIGGLYTGAADLALMERGLSAIERDSYEQVVGRKNPFEVSVATGSLEVPNHAMALVLFVHADNPLRQLTLRQADEIFDADHRRGTRRIETWGELGLRGEWVHKPIRAYIFGIDQDTSQYFQKVVMAGSQKWTGHLQEFTDLQRPDGSVHTAGQQIIEALEKDRYGMAISVMPYRTRQVRPLALAAQDGGPYVAATRETVAQRSYPLTRSVSIYANREPGEPLNAMLKEYLRFILSRQGQDAIAHDRGYLPLTAEIAEHERSRLQ